MTYDVAVSGNISILTVSFNDEGIDLTASIQVDGYEDAALQYLPFFEQDLRRNYTHLFPQPEMDFEFEEEMEQ